MTIARLRYDRLRQRRRGVRGLLVLKGQKSIDLAGIEAGEAEIEIRFLNFLQFESEQLFVPIRLRHRTIHHEPERLDLSRRPLVAEDHQGLSDAELARGLQPEVAINNLAIASNQAGNLEAELADRGTHSIHRRVVLPGVPWVLYKPFNRPNLDVLRRGLRVHALPSIKVILEDPSGGCALR
jgi:hypothetical protein